VTYVTDDGAWFRFQLAADSLAVRLTLSLAKCLKDFHLQVSTPNRAHQRKCPPCGRASSDFLLSIA
jgi:hypothetical protein